MDGATIAVGMLQSIKRVHGASHNRHSGGRRGILGHSLDIGILFWILAHSKRGA